MGDIMNSGNRFCRGYHSSRESSPSLISVHLLYLVNKVSLISDCNCSISSATAAMTPSVERTEVWTPDRTEV